MKLSWRPGVSAVKHKVYFGTKSDKLLPVGEVTDLSYDELPKLEKSTTYYWRIDEVQADGSVTIGDVWSFSRGKLVGWWKLDEAEGNKVSDSAGENNGTIHGAKWATGQSGGALRFDGTNHVVIPNESFFDFTGKMTVMAWMKASYDRRNLSTIIAKGSDGNGGWALQKAGIANGVSFWVDVAGMPWDGIKTNIAVFDNQWHHIAGVYDGKNAYIYVDGGVDLNSVSCSGSIKTNDQDVYIGQNPVSMARPWEGLIDDARVYNYALSADEIKELFIAAKPSSTN